MTAPRCPCGRAHPNYTLTAKALKLDSRCFVVRKAMAPTPPPRRERRSAMPISKKLKVNSWVASLVFHASLALAVGLAVWSVAKEEEEPIVVTATFDKLPEMLDGSKSWVEYDQPAESTDAKPQVESKLPDDYFEPPPAAEIKPQMAEVKFDEVDPAPAVPVQLQDAAPELPPVISSRAPRVNDAPIETMDSTRWKIAQPKTPQRTAPPIDREALARAMSSAVSGVTKGIEAGQKLASARASTGKAPAQARPSRGPQGTQIGGGPYPAQARREGREGLVLVRVEVLPTGFVGQAFVARSSGHADLDEAAIRASRDWRFNPAEAAGEAVVCWVDVPVRYEITSAR